MEKLIKGQLYEIHWIDAVSDSRWNDDDDLTKLIAEYEKGVINKLSFIRETKIFYAFTSGFHKGDDSYFDLHLIPRKWIKSIKPI